VIIENYYITGVYSTNPRNEHTFYIYIYLPNDYNTVNELLDLLTNQLASMQAAGYPTSPVGMVSVLTTTITNHPPTDELDDDPIETATTVIPTQLQPYAYKYRITLPNTSPSSCGLILLASRQAAWTTQIPETAIPTHLPNDLRHRLLQQTPTIIRANTSTP
jgi:hypothetical protein